VGEVVEDHHGLLVTERSETPLHLAVSLYNTETDEMLSVAGGSFLELGILTGW
jgi:hypothetical protein